MSAAFSNKVVTKVTDYFWEFSVTYELTAFRGPDADNESNRIILLGRTGNHKIVTSSKINPRKETVIRPPMDIDLSWLLSSCGIGGETDISFKINREFVDCHTPRRNREINDSLSAAAKLVSWCNIVNSYFRCEVFPVVSDNTMDLEAISARNILIPLLPVFHDIESYHPQLLDGTLQQESNHCISPLLNADESGILIEEQKRSFKEKIDELNEAFPSSTSGKLISAFEASYLLTLSFLKEVSNRYLECLDYIEDMLRQQLVRAIGKVVTPEDFSQYMNYHNRKLFCDNYQPRAFCYSVRRSDTHSPEGTVSIEETRYDSPSSHISTVVNSISGEAAGIRPMRFALNAHTMVTFGGDRHLHAWLCHSFSGVASSLLALKCCARQFSCYIVMVGRISSATMFEPKYAAIVQNKDELNIPLDLEQIPTPKQFRDAIESLSPEQQRFAKAYRAMQLESTLFGVCIIQIKPHLEKLLNLLPNSLTKEIELTQKLMNLFMDYQVIGSIYVVMIDSY